MSRRRRIENRPGAPRLWLALGAVGLVLILGIVGFGYYWQSVGPARGPAVRVNNVTYDMGYLLKMLRLLSMGPNAAPGKMALELPQLLMSNELIRQGSPRYNISVTPAEVDSELRRRVLPPSSPGEEAEKARLDREFQHLYQQRLNEYKLSDGEYRRIVEIDLLREKLRERLGERVPTVAEQVHVQAIVVADEAKVTEAEKKLQEGKDFVALVKEYSVDEDSRDKDGDLGWFPREVKPAPFDEIVFSLETGAVSSPFSVWDSPGGQPVTYLVKVLEKAQVREIDKKNREKLKDRALDRWVEEERKANDVQLWWDQDKYFWVLKELEKQGIGGPKKES
ncbi:MAG: peptidylprolyl isomerase [Chloroflexota bacterium]|nr:peptidylprolyl isomerase [Chloroflexota bacterium]